MTDQIDVADVDAELERRGCDQRLELAVLETLLSIQALLARAPDAYAPRLALLRSLGPPAGKPMSESAPAIGIEADPFATQEIEPVPPGDWESLSLDEFIEAVQMAGIVGMGSFFKIALAKVQERGMEIFGIKRDVIRGQVYV